ncbi:MAG: MoaD/ThiS family protein [Bryobacterales bacterium]|nr:MoaD/ThiS family protein [Bryobacterales bacterium]
MIRVVIPMHLRTLAKVDGELLLDVAAPVTPQRILDVLEADYPVLRGAIREHASRKRRPWLRYFACEEDLSHLPPEQPLPEAVVEGREPFFVVGAIAGG